MRRADLEVTNRCNAYCNFCPRDRMPALGAMNPRVFDRVLQRLVEHPEPVEISFCGFGEPLLNPELSAYAEAAARAGLRIGVTTNASLLDEARANELLDIGLDQIWFSISDLEEDYEEVYNLEFDRTSRNIDYFLAENERRGKPCQVWVSLVQHDINREKVDGYRDYWKKKGVDHFFRTAEQNRGGALERGYLFSGTDACQDEAEAVMEGAGMSILCPLPFHTISIDWAGQYLLCCQDWEKRLPLGHVQEHSVADIDRIKRERLVEGNPVCRDCSVNPLNLIRERLLEMDQDPPMAEETALEKTVEELKAGTRSVQHILDAIEV